MEDRIGAGLDQAEIGLTGNDDVHQLVGERVQPCAQDICKQRYRHDHDGYPHQVPGTAGAEFPGVCCNAGHGSNSTACERNARFIAGSFLGAWPPAGKDAASGSCSLERVKGRPQSGVFAMAIKFGRPIEMRDAPRRQGRPRRRPARSRGPPAPQPQGRMGAAAGARERAHRRRPDLAAVRGRRRRQRACRSPRCRASSGCRVDQAVRDAERAAKLGIPCIALFPYTDPALRDDDGTRGAQPRQPGLPRRSARSRRRCPRSACSATWRSIPTPATAMTA